ncbi:NUDIX domain-containing protein [Kineosporia sp. J2-2]|uniref:NUDIX domain-containing protein n=1 Tax=Kineosporia corallincola TaxID=2835133 RepID=A0ABS5TI31_9ACTN|nr:NUDIX domain-containing protein [Kineosporia corallincola]MBT0770742.1 NUDIX domain-containing protein [Kineosporia corallincola]
MGGLARKRKQRQPKIRRARVITLAPSGRVAMIERNVRGDRYFSVPGGRLEPGESPEQAAVREIREELGLEVTLAGRLPDHDGQAYFLAVVPGEPKLRMSGPETRHSNRNNRYTPRWVDLATLDSLPLRHPVRPLVTTAVIAVAATMQTVDDEKPVTATASATGTASAPGKARDRAPAAEVLASEKPAPETPAPETPAIAAPEDGKPLVRTVIDLTGLPEDDDSLLLGPRAEFDPAVATFAFGQRIRRRFTLRSRGWSREERRNDRVGSRR